MTVASCDDGGSSLMTDGMLKFNPILARRWRAGFSPAIDPEWRPQSRASPPGYALSARWAGCLVCGVKRESDMPFR